MFTNANRYGKWALVAALFAALILMLGGPLHQDRTAEAAIDMTGKWNVSLSGTAGGDTCSLNIVQTGSSLTADASCVSSGSGPYTGSITKATGDFSLDGLLTGGIFGNLSVTSTGNTDGSTMNGTFSTTPPGSGTFTGSIKVPPPANYTCYIAGGPSLGVSVNVENQFMPDGALVTVDGGYSLCPPTGKNGDGIPFLPTMRCFNATTPVDPDVTVDVEDQYGVAAHVIGPLTKLCVQATKDGSPPGSSLYYACYESVTTVGPGQDVDITNQFISETISIFGIRMMVCVPSLKDGAGITGSPALTCYLPMAGTPVEALVNIRTQFGLEVQFVDSLYTYCTEAEKLVPNKLPKPGDTDGDGCPDEHENGPDETQGGRRDYKDPNEYYDVYGPGQSLTRDGVIDLANDILGVIVRFAPLGTEPEYDVRFDRGPQIGANTWNMGPPDGVIDLANDILGVILQFNHSCV